MDSMSSSVATGSEAGEDSAHQSAAQSAAASRAEAARQAQKKEWADRCKDLNVYPTAPETDKHKSTWWRAKCLHLPFKEDARGGFYCMELDQWGKGKVSQAKAHVKNNHPDEFVCFRVRVRVTLFGAL